MHYENNLKLPYRQYLFAVEVEPEKLPDNTINPLAGQAKWFFAYGERNWIDCFHYVKAKEQTERFIANRQRDGDINYEVNCQ